MAFQTSSVLGFVDLIPCSGCSSGAPAAHTLTAVQPVPCSQSLPCCSRNLPMEDLWDPVQGLSTHTHFGSKINECTTVCISNPDVLNCFFFWHSTITWVFAQPLAQLLKLGRRALWTSGKQWGRRRRYLLSRAIIYHFQTVRQDKE